jgi:uncharacterized membrane protein
VTWANPFPWWVVAALVAAAAGLAWRAAWAPGGDASRSARLVLAALRLAALLLPLVLLMRPVWLVPDIASGAHVAVLVDTTRSMALADAGGASRIDAAVALVRRRLLPALQGRFGVDILALGEELREVPLERLSAAAPAADLGQALDALQRRYAGRRLAGVVLVSDGGLALPSGEALTALATLPPLYTIGVGRPDVERDHEVRELSAGDPAMVGSAVDLAATVVSQGFGRAAVTVRASANGRPVETRQVVPDSEGAPFDVVFRVEPPSGTATLYTVEVAPDSRELTDGNNRRSVLVPPAGRPRRVLVVEGAPGFEHSFVKRALAEDPGLEVDAVVPKGPDEAGAQTYYIQAAASRAAALTRGFPDSRQALFAYDTLILANVGADNLGRDQLALVAEFVASRGGGLLVLGGRSFDPAAVAGTPLDELLPVEVSDRGSSGVLKAGYPTHASGVVLTVDGERHPVMRLSASAADTRERWAGLPPLASMAPVGAPRPGATVLAFASGPGAVVRPLVAVQRYGRGRVLAFTGEGAFRWRMRLASTDRTYETFWRQAVRWLAAGAPDSISVRTVPAGPGLTRIVAEVYDGGFDPVADADVRVRVTGPAGERRSVTLAATGAQAGQYAGEVRLEPGVSKLEVEAIKGPAALGRADVWAFSDPGEAELVDPRRHDGQLARLAAAFGGRRLDEAEIDRVAAELVERQAAAAPLVERDLWHTPWAFLGLVALLVGEWALRRRWGLR